MSDRDSSCGSGRDRKTRADDQSQADRSRRAIANSDNPHNVRLLCVSASLRRLEGRKHMTLQDNRIVKAFAELRAQGRRTVLPFLTAGYPSLEATVAMLHAMEGRGVRVCELGVPFSDPVADGPTIQASYTEALADGVTPAKICQAVARYRSEGGELAVLAMVSYSIIYRHGPERYLDELVEAGFDGMILPDLPVNEAAAFVPLARDRGLCAVLLIAPTSRPERRVEIARQCSGFVYYISVAGITGERDRLPEQTIDGVAELRNHVDTPICVGFGISRPEMVKTVCDVADGAIVGSAIIHRITDNKTLPVDELADTVADLVAELLAPLQ